MMRPLISVIIPVYKVEEYLKQCVDSVIAQTYKNLEIILVDDGSPDNCPKICDEYADKDKRIKVIHKENGGLSDARNAGLDIATGDWISFIDSDDWIESNMYEVLLDLAQKYDAQISVGGVADEISENGQIIIVKTTQKDKTSPYVLSNTQAMEKYFLGSWSAWDKIYRREIFENIRFPVGEINEDEAIVLQLLERCDSVCYIDDVFYHYIKHPQSITTSEFSIKKIIWKKHCKDNLDFVKNKYPGLAPVATQRYRCALIWLMREIALCDKISDEEGRKLRSELLENRKIFKNVGFYSKTEKLHYAFLLLFPFGIYKKVVKVLKSRG